MNEKEITICGHTVKMIYCAATENLFESITNKSIAVFVPSVKTNGKGEAVIDKPAEATIGDYSILGVAGITAYYLKNEQESPVTVNDLLYSATPVERNTLIEYIVELRNSWYNIPNIVKDAIDKENAGKKGDEPKNAHQPTTAT